MNSTEKRSDAQDAARYRWLRAGNGYAPEENYARGGTQLDALCDDGLREATCQSDSTADAPDAEKGSSSFSLMLPSVAERSLVEAVHALVLQLAENNQQQSQMIHLLSVVVDQNSQLIEDREEQDEEEATRLYMDGSPM